AALSVVQNEFEPVHELYSDYIQNPRDNGYQSIHAKVIYAPNSTNGRATKKVIEVQIRTDKMHEEAETGIAAHWLYKEGRRRLDEVEEKLIQLRQKIFDDAKDPEKFIQSLKVDDLFQNEIYVFSPDHDLWQLERDSTPVDFAFHVHTDVGFHCIGAKVNGKLVPLNHRLKNGDMVEIITSNNQHPNQDWLKYVKTSKAKSKIRRWIKETQFEQSCRLGEDLLNKTLAKFHISLKNDEVIQLAKDHNYQDVAKFYAAIGRGDLTPTKIVNKIAPEKLQSDKHDSFLKRFIKLAWGIDNTVKVQGLDNLLINFGKCCQPLPGDRIVGFITKGRGVVIHRTDCKNVPKLLEDEDRNIDVQWAVNDSKKFVAKINMIAENNRVFLRDITDSLASMNTNIVSMNMKSQDTLVSNVMVIEVLNLNHLNRIMNRVRKIKGVISVQRIDGNYSTLNLTENN
ncbi:TGS domain-containing protein, partial [candidate division KSB1 bacterium]|nr:TGS domain-containing protein [candidate division KSB1 bacterium]